MLIMKEGYFYYYRNIHSLGVGSRVCVFDGHFGFNTIIHYPLPNDMVVNRKIVPYRYGFRVKQLNKQS